MTTTFNWRVEADGRWTCEWCGRHLELGKFGQSWSGIVDRRLIALNPDRIVAKRATEDYATKQEPR